MKILFIAPRLPLPPDTGAKIRTFNIIKQIKKFADVDVACFSFEQDDQRHVESLRQMGIPVHLVPSPEPGLWAKAAGVLFHHQPFSIVKYHASAMVQMIRSLQEKNRYDLVHMDHIHMAHYQRLFELTPCVVDEHNVEYKILERCAGVEKKFFKKRMFLSQARKMRHFESVMVGKMSACLAVSADDASVLRGLISSHMPVHVIDNGVDTGFFRVSEEPVTGKSGSSSEENALVFTGSMDWLPNDDAVVYFCKEILPLIWCVKPDVTFYVVGKNPSATIKELAQKDKRIVVTGVVDDVRVYVERSKVFVVPLRIGGGSRLKILEAMSMRRAVVSTRIGAEGIKCAHGKDIVLADHPEDFASEVLGLLDAPQKRELLGRQARELVCGHYDWDIIGKRLNKIYAELISKT